MLNFFKSEFSKMLMRWTRKENIERPHLLIIGAETVNALAEFKSEIPYPRERAASNGLEWAVELSDWELDTLTMRVRQTAANLIGVEARSISGSGNGGTAGVRSLHGPALLLGALAIQLTKMCQEFEPGPESVISGPSAAQAGDSYGGTT